MKTNTTLQIHYYCLYVVLLALLAVAHFIFAAEPFFVLPDNVTMMVSTVNILFLLAIPLMFKLFAIKVKVDSGVQNYAKWALVQMYLISFPALSSIVVYGLIGDRTALYCYLIAFVSLIFCKPTKQKWEYYQQNASNQELERGGDV